MVPASVASTAIVSFAASPDYSNPGDEITFFANASSNVANASLRFVIYYDSLRADYTNNTNSPVSVNTTANPGSVVTKFTYNTVGNLTTPDGTGYSVALYVSDGTNTVSTRILVVVTENVAPYFAPQLLELIPVDSGEQVLLETTVYDRDDDAVVVTWDFGDGSAPAVNSTPAAGSGIYLSQLHVWTVEYEPGRGDYPEYFYLNVTADDGQGNLLTTTSRIEIYIPFNKEPVAHFFADSGRVDPQDNVTLRANATDLEGDPLTWTFIFNNSYDNYSTVVKHTDFTAPNTTVWMNISHVFGVVGNFTVYLYISDAYVPYQTGYHNLSLSVAIKSIVNTAPVVSSAVQVSPPDPSYNETIDACRVLFTIEASDLDGDVMSVTWDFGDGSAQALNTSGSAVMTYQFRQEHFYSEAGFFNVSVVVTDGRDGHESLRYKVITVRSNNSAPIVLGFNRTLSNGTYGAPGSTANFSLMLQDAEGDQIEVCWDFGDGSQVMRMNLIVFDEQMRTVCSVNHTYVSAGNYTVTVWYTDHKFDTDYHNGSVFCLVKITTIGERVATLWDWWDYSSLALVFVSAGAVVARWMYIGHQRKLLDRQGKTLEEYRIMMKEQKAAAEVNEGKGEG